MGRIESLFRARRAAPLSARGSSVKKKEYAKSSPITVRPNLQSFVLFLPFICMFRSTITEEESTFRYRYTARFAIYNFKIPFPNFIHVQCRIGFYATRFTIFFWLLPKSIPKSFFFRAGDIRHQHCFIV